MKGNSKRNALLIYGGGLCDPANLYMREQAEVLKLTGLFNEIYIGFYSFESLLNPEFICKWNKELKAEAEKAFGGFFGTCRDIWLTDDNLREEAIKNLRAKDITWVFVGGGDGSARNCAEIAQDFNSAGIGIAFLMPCTVDGIEGSKSIGIRPAVRVSCQIIEQLVSTSLHTRSAFKSPGLIVKFQGRNRDDILARAVQKISSGEVRFNGVNPMIIAIPANYPCNLERVAEKVNAPENAQKPALILLSEGATVSEGELQKMFTRKFRSFDIAHLTQMNGMSNNEDKMQIIEMLENAFDNLVEAIEDGEPFALAYHGEHYDVTIEGVDYYLKRNPREGQVPTLNSDLEEIMRSYLL